MAEPVSSNIFLFKEDSLVYLLIKKSDKVKFEIGFSDPKNFNKLSSVKQIVEKNKATAGINLSYFGYPFNDFKTGDIRGYCIINGELLKSRSIWDSWMDVLLVYSDKNSLSVRRLKDTPKIILKINGKMITDDLSVNISHWGSKRDYALFFNGYGLSYIPSTMKGFPLKGSSVFSLNDSNEFTVLKNNMEANESASVITSATENLFTGLKNGDKVVIKTDFSDDIRNSLFCVSVGSVFIENDRYIPSDKNVNDNKSFLGIFSNGNILVGCSSLSNIKLGKKFETMGIKDCVLFDGGGSSCLNLKGENIFGGQRDIANALLIRDADD